MKTAPVIFSALFLAFTLSSCSSAAPESAQNSTSPLSPQSSQTSPLSFTYDSIPQSDWGNILFAPDENGLLYTLDNSENVTENGVTSVTVRTYSLDGGEHQTFSVPFNSADGYISIASLEYGGGSLYLQTADSIFAYDISSQALTELCSFENQLSAVEKIAPCNDGLYLLGTPPTPAEPVNKHYTDENGINVYFGGSPKALYRIGYDGNISPVSCEYPIALADNSGTPLLYAFDGQGGYYFTEISDNAEISKTYNNSFGQTLGDIDCTSDGAVLLSGYESGKLSAAPSPASAAADVMNNIWTYLPGDVKCSGQYIFLLTGENLYDSGKKIRRIPADTALSKGTVNVITSEYVWDMPFSDGYEINKTQISEDMFAVKTLSGSSGFDISYFSSDAPYAENMHSASSFYPLNQVPEIADYLDNCLPCVKAACTNDNGEIWAMPLSLDVPVIVYNRRNCEKAGITFSEDLGEFIAAVHSAAENQCRYDCTRYSFVNALLSQYLANSTSFDTPQFRILAAALKDDCPPNIFTYDDMIYSDLITYNIDRRLELLDPIPHTAYNEIFFTLIPDSRSQTEYLSDDENLSAAPLPKAVPGSLAGECTFICINPKGENLDNALNYAASLASRLNSPENLLIASSETVNNSNDTDYLRTLRDICSQAEIYFAVPSSVYSNDFDNYCSGLITLDDFITAAEQKMKLYKGERE
ncbi:MAG: hypothetical protein NC078_08120 [Ruminococcus sp.]|nr:hypothetical protein [Ruminococcus sp.]